MKHNHRLILAIVFLGFVNAAKAENPFDSAYEKACTMGATAASCTAWIDGLQESPRGKGEDAQLVIAAAYTMLGDTASNPQDRATYLARAREVYAAVVKENPKSRDGLGGLAMFAGTRDEEVTYRRRALAAEPTNVYSLQFLAHALTRDNPSAAELSEAAELVGLAYKNYSNPDGYRWKLANDAIGAYRSVGREADAEAVRAHALKAYGYDDAIARLSHPEGMSPEELNSTLTEICYDPLISIGGAKGCLDSLKATSNAVATAPSNSRAKLVDAGSRGMYVAAEAGATLSEVDPDWQNSFTDSLDKFVASGHATPTTYSLYGDLARDRHKRLEVLEAGAAKFPNNGELAYSAGLAELNLGHRDDAARSFTRAKELAPANSPVHPAIDQLIQQASKQ